MYTALSLIKIFENVQFDLLNVESCLLQATVEKQNKCLLNDIADANHRHEELQSAIGDADVTKKKLAAEKTDLDKQIADADATVRSLGKLRTSLSTQV